MGVFWEIFHGYIRSYVRPSYTSSQAGVYLRHYNRNLCIPFQSVTLTHSLLSRYASCSWASQWPSPSLDNIAISTPNTGRAFTNLTHIPTTAHRQHFSINYTFPDHSYDFFTYKILRISRNSKDSRKGQDRIVGSALLVFAPAALRPVVIIDL